MSYPLLYHAPPSFYSQIARLLLEEMGVEYETRIVMPGPPTFGTYTPEYMRMNPQGTVPTLMIGNMVLDDSRKMVDLCDTLLAGVALTPPDSEDRVAMVSWIEKAYDLPERELAYGTGLSKFFGQFANKLRLHRLHKLKTQHPEMVSIYENKIADIEKFYKLTHTPEHVADLIDRYAYALDDLDTQLGQSQFVASDTYSLADVVWTVTIARQKMLGQNPLYLRPNLARWFARVQSRPTYQSADIWDRFKVTKMLHLLGTVLFKRKSA